VSQLTTLPRVQAIFYAFCKESKQREFEEMQEIVTINESILYFLLRIVFILVIYSAFLLSLLLL
jgi:hypothetical protein